MPKFLASLTLIAILALAGCRAAPMYNATDVVFTQPLTTVEKVLTIEDYKNAIRMSGTDRSWTFVEAGPGHLQASVVVRKKHFATVDILFDTKSFSVTYKSSENLNYHAGSGEIHPRYNQWIMKLQKDIQAEIAKLKAS